MRITLFLGCCLCTVVSAAVYQYTGPEGQVHYSDQPVEGAKEIKVVPLPTYVAPTLPATQTGKARKKDSKIIVPSDYRVAIASPSNQATLRNTREVSVTLSLSPALRKQDKVIIYLDGSPATQHKKGAGFVLSNVDRGTHTIKAVIQDPKGRVLASSSTTTFYLHQAHRAPKRH